VKNANGKFVKASIEAVTAAAAAAAKQMPADYRVSITNAPGDAVYPISSFTWLLLYQDPQDKAQGKAMVDFMKWGAHRRPEIRRRDGLRAGPGERRRDGDEDARHDQGSIA
jgi:ABC-type phosphate transport system substrate-binding protein